MKSKSLFLVINKKYYTVPLVGSFLINNLNDEEKKVIDEEKDCYMINASLKKIDTDTYYNILKKVIYSSLSYINALSMDDEKEYPIFSKLRDETISNLESCTLAFAVNTKLEDKEQFSATSKEEKLEIIVELEQMIKNIINYYNSSLLEEKRNLR